ncbi:MAG: hypothetical protein U9Q37_09695 [Euryarchaeota archaeon]|nr:hypothetical protein [Euryarchaeota archaeon]
MTWDLGKLKPAYVLPSDLEEIPPAVPQRPRSIDPVSAVSPIAENIRTISSAIDASDEIGALLHGFEARYIDPREGR